MLASLLLAWMRRGKAFFSPPTTQNGLSGDAARQPSASIHLFEAQSATTSDDNVNASGVQGSPNFVVPQGGLSPAPTEPGPLPLGCDNTPVIVGPITGEDSSQPPSLTDNPGPGTLEPECGVGPSETQESCPNHEAALCKYFCPVDALVENPAQCGPVVTEDPHPELDGTPEQNAPALPADGFSLATDAEQAGTADVADSNVQDPIQHLTPDAATPQPRISQYQPRLRERSDSSRGRPAKRAADAGSAAATRRGTLEADFLLAFRPGGWGTVLSMLLRRPEEAETDEVAIRFADEVVKLAAIDDQFLEPVPLIHAGAALSQGAVAESVEPLRHRWVRTGRRLHVFSERAGVPGFASVPRVLIGQENVILCGSEIADDVLGCCSDTGSSAPLEISGPGVPEGWRCFREFRPHAPGDWSDKDEIFFALSPLPNAAIEFAGGISLGRANWLAGRPPAIHILGADPSLGDVTIDDTAAVIFERDQWIAPGWDAPGQHVVRYKGISRSYEIVEAEESWPAWPGHVRTDIAIAGAVATNIDGLPEIVLAGPSCWLLGARPGELVHAAAAACGFAACVAPRFRPVWAIEAKVSRRRPIPRLLDTLDEPGPVIDSASPEAVALWCRLVRDAARTPIAKGLESEAGVLWRRYGAAARSLKRRAR